jgi:hypothetical protein
MSGVLPKSNLEEMNGSFTLKGARLGSYKVPAPDVLIGKLIREKHSCVNCLEYGTIEGRYVGTEYAVYTSNEGFLCKTCAKKKKVI